MSHPATDVVPDLVETLGDRSGSTQGKEFANAPMQMTRRFF
jgi:hypothetical protein